MKNFLSVLVIIFSISTYAQEQVYVKKGYAVEGYDVVSYFQNKAAEGKEDFATSYEGVAYKFISKENMMSFTENPTKYIPQYGGFCAYAVAYTGKKIGVNPKTFLIKEDKLYLFYNSLGTNTLKKWNKVGHHVLKPKADANWQKTIK